MTTDTTEFRQAIRGTGPQGVITSRDIPPPAHMTCAAVAAFRDILEGYFAQYPVAMAPGYQGFDLGQEWRDDVKRCADDLDPRHMCMNACDSGVPNELVLGAYTLLFL